MTASDPKIPRAALVTGGAKRIGRAIVLALAREGYAVAIHASTSRDAARVLSQEIEEGGGKAGVVIADLADHRAIESLVSSAIAAIGPLTLLVNNAGEFEPDRFANLDRERFDRQFAVNLRAPLMLAEAFAAQVPAGADASIVNILDQRVFKPTPAFFSYTLTKSALFTATTTMAQTLAPNIRVNAVAPGPTLASARQDEQMFARQSAALPLQRGPSPEEIADAVVFLAGARSITGQTIAVDGGQRLAWQTPDAAGIEE